LQRYNTRATPSLSHVFHQFSFRILIKSDFILVKYQTAVNSHQESVTRSQEAKQIAQEIEQIKGPAAVHEKARILEI